MNQKKLNQETEEIKALSADYVKFYTLPQGQDLNEITEDLLNSPCIKNSCKQTLRAFGRRVFIFTYPSDGLKIKGVISFTKAPQDNPPIIYLRGGNRTFGILNPASDLMSPENYTVIATTYRGGVSEGEDEYGGKDINDVKNLINFLPVLEEKLHLHIPQENMFLIGNSRGGMQMFLALARFPELQARFAKIVALSGLLDMRVNIATRPDMKQTFADDFGFVEGENSDQWINWRDPLLTVAKVDPSLPILIIQGTNDNRISLLEGHHMVRELQSHGNLVTYWEIEGGDHCLRNQDDFVRRILDWLEK